MVPRASCGAVGVAAGGVLTAGADAGAEAWEAAGLVEPAAGVTTFGAGILIEIGAGRERSETRSVVSVINEPSTAVGRVIGAAAPGVAEDCGPRTVSALMVAATARTDTPARAGRCAALSTVTAEPPGAPRRSRGARERVRR